MPEARKPGAVNYGRWIAATLGLTVVILFIVASVTIYIDPLFHYHGPLERYEYPIYDERYQNDGITRNFEYSGLITGTSMTENFKTSEAEALFGVPFVKVPFAGAGYKEVDGNLRRGLAVKKIDYVIWGLDYNALGIDKDYARYTEYPDYLYNDDYLDDVYYVLNKTIFLDYTRQVLGYTRSGRVTTTFDEYKNWNGWCTFGAEAVLGTYSLGTPADGPVPLSEVDRQTILENIRQNVTNLSDMYPETTFYLFFTPYSICLWDQLNNAKGVDYWIDREQVAIEEILKHQNIRLHCFFTNFGMITNLDNYTDTMHYGEWINSWMLEQMYNGNYLLTEDNYQEHLAAMRKFYNSYDYASLHS